MYVVVRSSSSTFRALTLSLSLSSRNGHKSRKGKKEMGQEEEEEEALYSTFFLRPPPPMLLRCKHKAAAGVERTPCTILFLSRVCVSISKTRAFPFNDTDCPKGSCRGFKSRRNESGTIYCGSPCRSPNLKPPSSPARLRGSAGRANSI